MFLIETPVTTRDIKRFGVERLNARGTKVGFLDVTGILNPNYPKDIISDCQQPEKLIQFYSKEAFVDYFAGRDLSGLVVINFLELNAATTFIYSVFEKYGVKYVSFCANVIPLPKQSLVVRTVVAALLQRIKNYKEFAYAPTYVLAGGKKYSLRKPLPNRHSRIIWAHALDYDLYLEYLEKPSGALINGKYAVFLDEYFSLHPDFMTGNGRQNPYIEYQEYYNELCQQLASIENKLDMPVVIAAHPRSHYEKLPNLFAGRKVVKGKSLELVADSHYVLNHGSTSINFAVMFRKPILFLMPQKVKQGYYGQHIRNFAAVFGKRPIDMRTIAQCDLKKTALIADNALDAYEANYIKKPLSPKRYFWDIVADKLETDGETIE